MRSDVAKRPPSSGTSGRSSGGMTGMTFMTIHSGRFSVVSAASRRFSTMPSRLRASALRCWLVSVRAWKRSSVASISRSSRFRSASTASPPIMATNFSASSSARRLLSSRIW